MSKLGKPTHIQHRCSAIVAAVALAFACNANANLIADGGFEGDATHTPDNGGHNDADTGIPSWTVYAPGNNQNVQWIHNDTYPSIQAHGGVGLIDLSGNPDNFGGLQQSFATSVGAAYKVTFYLGYAEADMNFGGPVSATVSLGGSNAQRFSTGGAGGTQTSTVWTAFEYDFTATSASTLLRFASAAGDGVHFIGLDDVDVEAALPVAPGTGAVPEPASIALLGLGLVGGALVRRRVKDAMPG